MSTDLALLRGRYRILAPIGEGGMGAVSLAEDTRLPGRRCAIKRVAPPGDSSVGADDWRRAALREAAVLARLDHRALPNVSDVFDHDGAVHLVMDYVAGQDLLQIIHDAHRRGRHVPETQAIRWAEDVCVALTYLHRQAPPVLHRDVKPSNIKLTPDGQIRLVDFGLAGPARWQPHNADADTVIAGGTAPYRAPEQSSAGREDARSDVYALGATLYHLLTGRAPPAADVRFLDPDLSTDVRDLRRDVSPRLANAVSAAMALHPDARPRSAESLRLLLVAGPSPAAATSEWFSAVRANRWLLALVVALLLAALAVTAMP